MCSNIYYVTFVVLHSALIESFLRIAPLTGEFLISLLPLYCSHVHYRVVGE